MRKLLAFALIGIFLLSSLVIANIDKIYRSPLDTPILEKETLDKIEAQQIAEYKIIVVSETLKRIEIGENNILCVLKRGETWKDAEKRCIDNLFAREQKEIVTEYVKLNVKEVRE